MYKRQEEDKVTMDSDIMEDFEADSLDVVDLVMSIEDEFCLEVPDDQIENFRTVGDAVSYTHLDVYKRQAAHHIVFQIARPALYALVQHRVCIFVHAFQQA